MRGQIVYHRFIVNSPRRDPIPLDSPAAEQITAQGWIVITWSDRLEGMEISQVMRDTDTLATTLEGG